MINDKRINDKRPKNFGLFGLLVLAI